MNRPRHHRTQPAPRSLEASGKTIEDAIRAAISRLRARREDVEVEVLDEGRRGLLGMGARDARVRVKMRAAGGATRRDERSGQGRGGRHRGETGAGPRREERGGRRGGAGEDSWGERRGGRDQSARRGSGGGENGDRTFRGASSSERRGEVGSAGRSRRRGRGSRRPSTATPSDSGAAGARLDREVNAAPTGLEGEVSRHARDLLAHMGYSATVETVYTDGAYEVRVGAGDADAVLIGRRGETLEALQHILAKMASRGQEELLRIRVDVSHYRERRMDLLGEYARETARRVLETGGSFVTEPLPAAERRTIHRTIAEFDGVTTHAIGDGLVKRVWIGSESAAANANEYEAAEHPVGQSPELEGLPEVVPVEERRPSRGRGEPGESRRGRGDRGRGGRGEREHSRRSYDTAPAPADLAEPSSVGEGPRTDQADDEVLEPLSFLDSWSNEDRAKEDDAPAWGRRPKPARGRRR